MVTPLADIVLIEPLVETKTKSGIIIPDTAKERPVKGRAVAVGVDVDTIKEGDTLLYKKWGGTEVKVKDKEMIFIRQDDILAIYEEEE